MTRAEQMRAYRKFRRQNPKAAMQSTISEARRRARNAKVPFSITLDDLMPLPSHCLITGEKLAYGGWNDWNAASIDRKIPSLGYIPGNVRVISRRANMIRFDCLDPSIFLALASDARDILRGLK